jgi:hypothetical protein
MYQLPGELTVPGTVDCAHRDHWKKHGGLQQASETIADGNAGAATTPQIIELADTRVIAVSRQPLKAAAGWRCTRTSPQGTARNRKSSISPATIL